MPSRVPLSFGSAAFGEAGKHVTRINDLSDAQELVDFFTKEHGYMEYDCARAYGLGTSEEYLGKLNLYGARVDTKCGPPFTLENLQVQIPASIKALGANKIRIFYFHAPDRTTPYEDQCEAINKMYKAGHFELFGLSNLYAWEVALIWAICNERNYVLPSVYQGCYNMIARGIEHELIPCLKKFNMRYMAFSPLAGGFLSGNLKSKDDPGQTGGRFDITLRMGQIYRERFTKGAEFEALSILSEVATKHNLTLTQIALRWLQHHSKLGPEDGIILGASSVQMLKDNVLYSEEGPLPEDVVAVCEEAWVLVKAKAPPYP